MIENSVPNNSFLRVVAISAFSAFIGIMPIHLNSVLAAADPKGTSAYEMILGSRQINGLHRVKSLPGSPKPNDLFEPYMPGVDLMSDMNVVFEIARESIKAGCPDGVAKNSKSRCLAIVTPERKQIIIPAPAPDSMPEIMVASIKAILPSTPKLNISVVSFTSSDAVYEDVTSAIPFSGYLFGFAYIGHNVVVFEGHPSAIASGLRDSDVLIVDSGMKPFLQNDWLTVAKTTLRPNAKIFIVDRESLSFREVRM